MIHINFIFFQYDFVNFSFIDNHRFIPDKEFFQFIIAINEDVKNDFNDDLNRKHHKNVVPFYTWVIKAVADDFRQHYAPDEVDWRKV
ncbi:hypothetical protein HMPREF3213_02793 [Heyndrickxia coagulans]|uniref:Uncharacterized protein n=1 Tax=Heyndrickxia coagulans TaxID=1398 RepID=A0A133KIG8_HEYCO|nr:hypothetical protein HMPREF3213_02793 [Heyndrickxia coagulans]